MKRFLIAGFGAAGALAAGISVAQAQDAPFYEGKTITVITAGSPGGTMDTTIRNFAEYWKKYIPGNPDFVVQNMPGGGGTLSTNFVYETAKPDGLTILYSSWNPLGQALDLPELRADYSELPFIGAVADLRVAYMRKDVEPGIEKPADIANAETFNTGGYSLSDWVDILDRVGLDILGVDYNHVTGYKGGSDVYAAVLRDEVQFTNTSYGTLLTRSADFIEPGGEGLPVFLFCGKDGSGEIIRYENIDVPCLQDLYQEIHGEAAEGPLVDALDWFVAMGSRMTFVAFAPPGTPDDAVTALRGGFQAAADDSELRQFFVDRSTLEPEFVSQQEADRAFELLANTPDEVLDVLKRYVTPE